MDTQYYSMAFEWKMIRCLLYRLIRIYYLLQRQMIIASILQFQLNRNKCDNKCRIIELQFHRCQRFAAAREQQQHETQWSLLLPPPSTPPPLPHHYKSQSDQSVYIQWRQLDSRIQENYNVQNSSSSSTTTMTTTTLYPTPAARHHQQQSSNKYDDNVQVKSVDRSIPGKEEQTPSELCIAKTREKKITSNSGKSCISARSSRPGHIPYPVSPALIISKCYVLFKNLSCWTGRILIRLLPGLGRMSQRCQNVDELGQSQYWVEWVKRNN